MSNKNGRKKIFGTDGVRGTANVEPVTAETALKLGRAAAYVTRSLRADAGIAITASHNPYTDNGIKFFRADGYKLDDNIEEQIENLVFSGAIENIRPAA